MNLLALSGVGGAALGAAAVLAWSFSPWGAETKLDKARETIVELRRDLKECTDEKAAIEETRSIEAQAARDDYGSLAVQCSAAASRALASGLSIGRITNDTSTNPDGSPRRRIVGAGELRGAIGQPQPAARP
jgi:hypothetical protein